MRPCRENLYVGDDFEPVIFVNVNTQCNVDCVRCYIGAEKRKNPLKNRVLDPAVLGKLLDHDVFREHPPTVIYEGGEPLLVGRELMHEYVSLVRRVSPKSRQTMVTNLFARPAWATPIIEEYFGNLIESTFALGKKYSLSGSEDLYIRRFKHSLAEAWAEGMTCPANVELNRETFDKGVSALYRVLVETGCKEMEFDYSIDFIDFFANPQFDDYGMPKLKGTISYMEFSEYLIELHQCHGSGLKKLGVSIGAIDSPQARRENMAFNVQRMHEFFTLNPDGTVTTGPFFSDLPETFIGDMHQGDTDDLLRNETRLLASQAGFDRAESCLGCRHHHLCRGGPSHIPLEDGSGECAGGKRVWDYFEQRGIT